MKRKPPRSSWQLAKPILVTANKPSHIQLVVPGEPEFVGVVRLACAGIAHRLDLDQELTDDLKLVATEACGRLLTLGAPQVAVSWELSDTAITLLVTAVGELAPQAENNDTGWEEIGLLLIESLMDEVQQLSNPVGLRAVKRLQPIDE